MRLKDRYAIKVKFQSFKVETIERKDPISQLEASKSSISNLMLNNLLNETKGFKYQMTLKFKLKNYRPHRKVEFRESIYFNSTTKTVINHRFRL